MSDVVAVRFLVSGRVQGVFYRASTVKEASRLALDGYARNLADGRVEVLARGDRAHVDALERWLRKGPPLARVDAVQREDAAGDVDDFPQPFAIRR
jgi:acylphosphatase